MGHPLLGLLVLIFSCVMVVFFDSFLGMGVLGLALFGMLPITCESIHYTPSANACSNSFFSFHANGNIIGRSLDWNSAYIPLLTKLGMLRPDVTMVR